jgi:hypothetical protein
MVPLKITIGTLSFGKRISIFDLKASDRIARICDSVRSRDVTLLACAGWSVECADDVHTIASQLACMAKETHVLIEVQNDKHAELPPEKCKHAMYWIYPDGKIAFLGKQHFATRGELNDVGGGRLLESFEANLHPRTVTAGELKIMALCCGELNILQGRHEVTCLTENANAALDDADIVINPTHDLMGNGGTLKAKRRYLSRMIDGRSRVSVSVSNWDHEGKYEDGKARSIQRPDAPTLHTVFLNGQPLNPKLVQGGSAEGFQYREWDINAEI